MTAQQINGYTPENITARVLEKKSKFNAYNNAKINSLHASLGSSELVDFFNMIPFLFTVNQPEFPGYVSEMKEPPGIFRYTPPSRLLVHLRTTNPSFMRPKASDREPVIRLVALIGSAGTIAFTPDSDLDFWICGRFSKMPAEDILLLRRKCTMIENWAMEKHRKEIYFFLNDIDHIKMNIFDEDEEYGLSGISLGQLLKEEFYRSSIIINDVTPFWWVVPADSPDSLYEKWFSVISKTPHAADYIDLGNMAGLNRGDFLIPSLFQIIKSLGNPFKSIIKLGLLERYIHDDKANPFLSNQIKKNVHEGKTDRSSVDAYCMMFDNVFSYYEKHSDDMTALNIIKTSFYLKVNPRLSHAEKDPGKETFRDVMAAYTKKWGWDNETIKRVDSFENWDVESTNRMMNNTKKSILRGYKNILNGMGSGICTDSIDRGSLLAINRKIYSHFNPEASKIDNTLNFKKYPPEKLLSLDYISDTKGNQGWYLSKRIITDARPAKILIRKSSHLINLVVWISLNGLYQKDFSRIDIEQGFYSMDTNHIRDLISELSERFSIKSLNLQNSYFLQDPFPVMSYILINPLSKYSKKIEEIIFLYHNSWGETRFEVFSGQNALTAITLRIINGAIKSGMDSSNALHITSSAPFSSTREFHQLKSSITSILQFFTEKQNTVRQRFITISGNRFTVFSNSVKQGLAAPAVYKQYSSEIQMLYSMSYNRGVVTRNRADESIPELEHLGHILSHESGDCIKIFFDEGRKYSRIYVLNERGSLVLMHKKSEQLASYLAGLISFSESAIAEVARANPGTPLAGNSQPVAVYKIETDTTGRKSIKQHDYHNDSMIKHYTEKNFQVCLSLHLLDTGEIGYRFTLPDGGLSEVFSRTEIESASREIATLMESVEGYSFYPVLVNLDNTGIKMYSSYTSFAFSEKNRFEMLIEKNLGMI
jgi:adenylate cyclase class 1